MVGDVAILECRIRPPHLTMVAMEIIRIRRGSRLAVGVNNPSECEIFPSEPANRSIRRVSAARRPPSISRLGGGVSRCGYCVLLLEEPDCLSGAMKNTLRGIDGVAHVQRICML